MCLLLHKARSSVWREEMLGYNGTKRELGIGDENISKKRKLRKLIVNLQKTLSIQTWNVAGEKPLS